MVEGSKLGSNRTVNLSAQEKEMESPSSMNREIDFCVLK